VAARGRELEARVAQVEADLDGFRSASGMELLATRYAELCARCDRLRGEIEGMRSGDA
jgi:outer membrane murein-binding lipoprotein Lpp